MKIPVVYIHRLLSIILKLEIVSTAESQKDELHMAKVRKNKDQSINISNFKTDVPLILGGMG